MEEIDPTKAIRYIQENAGKYAQAKANRVHIENFTKTLKARLMSESDKKTLGDREMDAYGSIQYEELLKGLKEAVEVIRKKITISAICICTEEASAEPEFLRKITKIGHGRLFRVGEEELPQTLLTEHEFVRKISKKMPKGIGVAAEKPLRAMILSILAKEGVAAVSSLSKIFGVKTERIAKELRELENEKLVEKIAVESVWFYYIAPK